MTTRLLVGEMVGGFVVKKTRHHRTLQSDGRNEVAEALLLFVAGSEFDFPGHVEGRIVPSGGDVFCQLTHRSPEMRRLGTQGIWWEFQRIIFSRVCADSM